MNKGFKLVRLMLGWSDFLEKKIGHLSGPKLKNFTFKYCFLTCRRAPENIDCCYPNISNNKNVLNFFFLVCGQGWEYHIWFLRAKSKEKLKKYMIFLWQSQNPSCTFRGPKKILKIFHFEFYFWNWFFEVKGKISQIFKNFNFYGSCDFLKLKTLRRVLICWYFGTPVNIHDQQQCVWK